MLRSISETFVAFSVLINFTILVSQSVVLSQVIESGSRLSPLSDQHELKVKKFDPPLLLAVDPEAQLNELRVIQNKQWEQIASIRGRTWSHLIDVGSKTDTVSLTEFLFEKGPKTRKLRWYPRKADRGRESHMPDTENMDLVFVYLSTPENMVLGTGYSRKGIDEIEIQLPDVKSERTNEFDFQHIFFPSVNSVDELHASIKELRATGRFHIAVSRNETLMEVKLWGSGGEEKYCRRWIFDLSKNGVAIYYEDLLSPSSGASNIETTYAKIDDFWLPASLTEQRFRINEWQSLKEEKYFDLSVNGKIEEREFQIKSLPVGEKVPVVDVRTGRGQMRLFGQFLK